MKKLFYYGFLRTGENTNSIRTNSILIFYRYRQFELGIFMYATVSLVLIFVVYTVFLVFGLQTTDQEKKKEE